MTSSNRVSPARVRWISLAAGGFFLTLLLAGIGTQLVASAEPGPADRLVWQTFDLFALSYLGSTLLVGWFVGIRRPSEWIRAFVVVALPLVIAIVVVALLPRGE